MNIEIIYLHFLVNLINRLYLNEKAVCGILQVGNRFVSVKRKDKESYGLIGGKVDQNETLENAIIRET